MLLVLTAAVLTGVVLTSKPVLHHNASSPLPWYAVDRHPGLIVSLVVLTVLHIRLRRAGARQQPPWPPPAAPARAGAGGSRSASCTRATAPAAQ